MRNKLLIAFLLSIFSFAAWAVEHPLANEEQELRAEKLFHEVRCVACQTDSVAESPTEVAYDIRQAIRARIVAGDNNAEIKQYLTARYGDSVMMMTPLNMHTATLWFGPTVFLVVGIAFIWIALKIEAALNK
jgi:cytochrome c-type biogenesis protein CcmH